MREVWLGLPESRDQYKDADRNQELDSTCHFRCLHSAECRWDGQGAVAAVTRCFEQAVKVYERIRCRPAIALTRLQLAELLLAHYPDKGTEAQEHLDFAIAEFREMKMRPSLERALRHKGLLKA